MDTDDTRRPRRRIGAVAAALALAVAIPVAGALASGSDGGDGGGSTPPARQVQDDQTRPDRPDRDCPKDRDRQQDQTALPV